MAPDNGRNEESREAKFLNTRREDLRTLELSWNNRKLTAEKVARHFIEILNSLFDVTRPEFFEAFEPVCADLEEYFVAVGNAKAELWGGAWILTAEFVDLLFESLRDGSLEWERIENLQSRIREETHSKVFAERETSNGYNRTASSRKKGSDDEIVHAQEESTMANDLQNDPKELLAKAQEALLSGNGDNAKEFALKAAELIAEAEAQEARRKEEVLKSEREKIAHEESEAEEILSEAKDEMAEQEQELAAFNKRLDDARSAFEKREVECQEIKKEIEKSEAEMASLKEKQKQLRERFQEAIPARDAAKRECSKIQDESKNLPSDVEALRENMSETEKRLKEIRQRKSEIDAELTKLAQKVSG